MVICQSEVRIFPFYFYQNFKRGRPSLFQRYTDYYKQGIIVPENQLSVFGRCVIYYNERKPNVTYPSYYLKYAYNELCGVEVYG